ncbi:MAG: hypothetical protein ABI972_01185 [Acidobacteriota bacterium]
MTRLVLALLLIPSAWFAWTWRSMPRAGEYHDDAIYYVSAKSLVQTGEYRIPSLPSQPKQTKYPPLWPAVLSFAWLSGPYPDNLPVAMLLCWLMLPATLVLFHTWLRREGFAEWAALGVCALWALNPYVQLFSTTMLSELPFLALALGAMLMLDRATPKQALVAGVIGGLAFLTRTAGIALLPAAVVWLWSRNERRQAGHFAAGMLPAVIAWAAWCAWNKNPAQDWLALYYTNYAGFHLRNFVWAETPLFLWKNLDGIVAGLGAYALPSVNPTLPEKILALTLAVAGLMGVSRLFRQRARELTGLYVCFAALLAFMLFIWHFPPNERFMLPVAPLWLAGFWTEMRQLASSIKAATRHKDRSQRVVAYGFGAFAACLLALCAWKMVQVSFVLLPGTYAQEAERLTKTEPMMAWMREHLPADARVMSENDPMLYLRTGLRGAKRFPPTVYWYREAMTDLRDVYLDTPRFARELGFTHLYFNDWDYSRDLSDEAHAGIIAGLKKHPKLELLHESGESHVYRILQ